MVFFVDCLGFVFVGRGVCGLRVIEYDVVEDGRCMCCCLSW